MTAQQPSADRRLPAAADWAAMVLLVLAAFAWVQFAPVFDLSSWPAIVATSVDYLVLFAPLVLLALGAGWVTRTRVLRTGERPAGWTATGLLVGAATLGASVLFSWLNGGLVPGAGSPVGIAWVVALVLVLFQVSAEELLFRGWLQPALAARFGRGHGVQWGAIAASSLLFAALHFLSADSLQAFFNMALGGLLFGLLAWRSGGILAPIAAHFAYNAVEDLGLGLVPNPAPGTSGSLVDLDLLGLPVWGGVAEGLNASIGTTAALLAAIVPLALYRSAAPSAQPAAQPA